MRKLFGKDAAWKLMLGALLVGLLSGAIAAPALAGTAYSSDNYYTVAGISYKNFAVVTTTTGGSGTAIARTTAEITAGTAPSGYIGAQARLYYSTGGLYCAGAWSYSNQSLGAGAMWNTTSCTATGHNIWYSAGFTDAWNGAAYNTYGTYQTPNQNS